MVDPETTPHTSPKRASVSFANICEKIDRAITAPHCIATSSVGPCICGSKHGETRLSRDQTSCMPWSYVWTVSNVQLSLQILPKSHPNHKGIIPLPGLATSRSREIEFWNDLLIIMTDVSTARLPTRQSNMMMILYSNISVGDQGTLIKLNG